MVEIYSISLERLVRFKDLYVVMSTPDKRKQPLFWDGAEWTPEINRAIVYHYSFVPKGAENGTPTLITYACYAVFRLVQKGCANCQDGKCIKDLEKQND